MMDALSLKDNTNNVYKNNVNKWGTFEGIRLAGQEEDCTARAAKRTFLSQDIDISIKQWGYVHSMYYITAHK